MNHTFDKLFGLTFYDDLANFSSQSEKCVSTVDKIFEPNFRESR